MFRVYVGTEVNHTRLKNAVKENSAWWELMILTLLTIMTLNIYDFKDDFV